MNERIKQLIEQCYETVPIGRDGWPEYSKLSEEKFAELIVRECANKVDSNLRDWLQDSNGTIGDKILEHFGVEA